MMGKIYTHPFVHGVYTTQNPKHIWGTLGGAESIKNQKIPNYPTHRNPHPTFYKRYMGIATASVGLFSCHSPRLQCSMDTLLGIQCRFLNSSLCSGVSTKLKNLPICEGK